MSFVQQLHRFFKPFMLLAERTLPFSRHLATEGSLQGLQFDQAVSSPRVEAFETSDFSSSKTSFANASSSRPDAYERYADAGFMEPAGSEIDNNSRSRVCRFHGSHALCIADIRSVDQLPSQVVFHLPGSWNLIDANIIRQLGSR